MRGERSRWVADMTGYQMVFGREWFRSRGPAYCRAMGRRSGRIRRRRTSERDRRIHALRVKGLKQIEIARELVRRGWGALTQQGVSYILRRNTSERSDPEREDVENAETDTAAEDQDRPATGDRGPYHVDWEANEEEHREKWRWYRERDKERKRSWWAVNQWSMPLKPLTP